MRATDNICLQISIGVAGDEGHVLELRDVSREFVATIDLTVQQIWKALSEGIRAVTRMGTVVIAPEYFIDWKSQHFLTRLYLEFHQLHEPPIHWFR